MKLLFVCLGNICRSPSAEAVARQLIAARGLADRIQCDSAGTGDWHLGHAPDARAQAAGARRGYDLSQLRARLLTPQDFSDFDVILVMDDSNLANARALQPANSRAQLKRLLDYLPGQPLIEVPDPYYGGETGFEQVLDLLEAAINALLNVLLDELENA